MTEDECIKRTEAQMAGIRCWECGTFFVATPEHKDIHCSEECVQRYLNSDVDDEHPNKE